METRASLKYFGPALDAGRMNVYEAAENMIAFSEFMVVAVKVTYGDSADVKAEVGGFEHNCFETSLVFNLLGPAATVFSAVEPHHIWRVVKGAIALWKHLQGRPPTAITYNGPNVSVTNNNGTIIQLHADALHLTYHPKGAEAVSKFIRSGLNHEGYESVRIEPEDWPKLPDLASEVSKEESGYFVPVAPESKISDNIVRMSVVIVGPEFEGSSKWRFSDGGPPFSASMLDKEFIRKVNLGERFGKGDVLDVDMHIVQTRLGMKVSADREVLKVHDHMTPPDQYRIE
jgi:hypothetical protein